MYSLVIWIGTVLSLLVFGYSLQPKIGIGAVFESLDYNHYNGVFYRTLEENQRIQNVNQSVNGRAIPVGDDLFQTIQGLCSFIKGRDIRSLLVVGKQRTIHSVSLVANPMGIPVLGYTTDMTDKFVQDIQDLHYTINVKTEEICSLRRGVFSLHRGHPDNNPNQETVHFVAGFANLNGVNGECADTVNSLPFAGNSTSSIGGSCTDL